MGRGIGTASVKGAGVAQEAVTMHKTIASYGLEHVMYDKFKKASSVPIK